MPAGAGNVAPLHAVFEYLRLLLAPAKLDAFRSLGAADASAAGPKIGALVLIGALVAFVAWRRRDPLARGGAILLLLPLLPALPLPFFLGAYVEERAATFASVGVVLLAASLVAWLGSALRPARRYAPLILIAPGRRGRVRDARAGAGVAGQHLAPPGGHEGDARRPRRLLQARPEPQAIGEYDAALAAVDRSIALDSTAVDPHHLRAVLLSRRGDIAGAEREARRSIALEPRDAIAWANLGDALTQRGSLPEALDACRRAVALDSTLADSWYNLGVALGAAGDLPDAADGLPSARSPSIRRHVQAVNNLGAVLASRGGSRRPATRTGAR